VSYVNLVFSPAVMGPYKNTQVGYVGSPKTIDAFETALKKFQTNFAGWPQFVRTIGETKYTFLKFPSPLEAFARLGGALPPPDLTSVPDPTKWPDSLWPPLGELRKNWTDYAGKVTGNTDGTYTFSPGKCGALPAPNAPPPTNFCDAIAAVTGLLLANYTNYRSLFGGNQAKCSGTAAVISDNLLISHVYGWGPWTESTDGIAGHGCPAAVNLLENTPDYFTPITNDDGSPGKDYKYYLNVKQAFDHINYGLLPAKETGQIYTFNPWVTLIHDPSYIGAPNAYAYSVDDAVGNIQAEGQGFIVDIGDTVNLGNQKPAGPPIQISLGFSLNDPIRFTNYAICSTDQIKPINPAFAAFAVSGTLPTCPVDLNNPKGFPIVYLWDNKALTGGDPRGQLYTFMIAVPRDQFPFFPNPGVAPVPKWIAPPPNDASTAYPIACTGNYNNTLPSPPSEPSSATWCCDKASSSGIYAFSAPEPHNAHKTKNFIVSTKPAAVCTDFDPKGKDPMCSQKVNVERCSQGMVGLQSPEPVEIEKK
jgi:hypothetical protein